MNDRESALRAFDHYAPAARAIAFRTARALAMIHGPVGADDVQQTALLVLWEVVCRGVVPSRRLLRLRLFERLMKARGAGGPVPLPDDPMAPIAGVDQDDLLDLRAAVAALPPDQAEAVRARYLLGHEGAALALGIGQRRLSRQVRRALVWLRNGLVD